MSGNTVNARNGRYRPLFSKSETKPNLEENEFAVSEWKLAFAALVLSLIVIACKVYYANRDYIRDKVLVDKLVTYETFTQEGDLMFRHGWKTVVRYSRFWLPALCGFLTTAFTWVMVYLDSDMPGVQPPSPLSPSKYKRLSGHTFHLNYVFSLMIGLMVFAYMFWKEASIEF